MGIAETHIAGEIRRQAISHEPDECMCNGMIRMALALVAITDEQARQFRAELATACMNRRQELMEESSRSIEAMLRGH